MKKLVVAFLALSLSIGSFAQSNNQNNKGHKEGKVRGTGQKKKMAEKLDLTEAQRTKLKSINNNFKKTMGDLRQNATLDATAKKQQRQNLLTEHRNQMLAVLTPEQKKQWAEEKKAGGKAWKQNRNTPNGRGKGVRGERKEKIAKVARELQLNNEQAAKLKTANGKFREEMQAIRKNEALTKDQKKEALQHLNKQRKEKMAEILTKEQVVKLQEIKKVRRENRPVRHTK